jgi:hypothetical protein
VAAKRDGVQRLCLRRLSQIRACQLLGISSFVLRYRARSGAMSSYAAACKSLLVSIAATATASYTTTCFTKAGRSTSSKRIYR